MAQDSIYKVAFATPPLSDDDRTEFYFTTVVAIYDMFTARQVGCGCRRLYNLKVPSGVPYVGKRCKITKELILKKRRKKAFLSI